MVWCHHLQKVNKSSGVHFETLFSIIFLFFDVPQYSHAFDYIKLDDKQSTLTSKKSLHITFRLLLRMLKEQNIYTAFSARSLNNCNHHAICVITGADNFDMTCSEISQNTIIFYNVQARVNMAKTVKMKWHYNCTLILFLLQCYINCTLICLLTYS